MTFDLDGLAEFVKRIRTEKSISQEEVAKNGGPSTGWIGSLEAGTRTDEPKPATLRRLAKGLGVPVFEVFKAAGIEPITDEDAGRYPLNNRAERERFLELAKSRKHPPTDVERELFLNAPDSPPHVHRMANLDLFDQPAGNRTLIIASLFSDVEALKREAERLAMDAEASRFWASFQKLPQEDREELEWMMQRRLERIQRERKPEAE